jgi:enamine deaminase RidA (YjgF/YER057c/UK114 family)
MDVYSRMNSLGLKLPPAPENGGIFVGCKTLSEDMLYVSGCGCTIGESGTYGKVGRDVTLEEAQNAASDTMRNFLAVLEKEIGDLNRIVSFVKLLVFVSSDPDFYDQPKVANGATKLLVDLFGEKIGCPSRSSIGVAVLPNNISVEIEGVVKIR